MEKLDLTRLYKIHINATTTPEVMDRNPARFLSLTGEGKPCGEVFLEKIKALYATAYAIKFRWKQAGKDFIIPKLEVLQYGEGKIAGVDWGYRLLIRVPDGVSEFDVQKGIECVIANMDIQLANNIKMHHIGANAGSPIIRH